MSVRLLRTIVAAVLALTLSGCLPWGVIGDLGERLFGEGPIGEPDAVDLPVPKATFESPSSPDRQTNLTSDVKPEGFAPVPGDGSLNAYFAQTIEWSECGEYECATFLAPLDWFNPAEQAITIAMLRQKGPDSSRGVIFVNPGGPGGSAQDYAAGFDPSGVPGYDIIGMDSRGSGESTPVVCGTTEETDAWFATDNSPDDEQEKAALRQANMDFARQCREHSGALLDHISSIETIYDYDLARALLGQEKLNFYGVSYGTFLGSVYAELYPQRVGRMVLDSAVNLRPDSEVIQAEGFDLSLRAFAAWCAGESTCTLGNTEDAVVDRVVSFLNDLDAHPMDTFDESRPLTQSLAVSGLALFFYFGAEVYPDIADVLIATLQTSNGTFMLKAADAMNDRDEDGTYGTIAYAFPAISCVDEADDGEAGAYEKWESDKGKAPVFGQFFGPAMVCQVWTARPAVTIDFSGAGAPPILIVQNTGDSATPYENAEIMAEELESAVLISREAPGHGAYQEGSACLDDAVNAYFADGTVPQNGLRCPA